MSPRDHIPVVIEDFNGLYRRGAADECPLDHFTDLNNVVFVPGGVKTRDGIEPFQDVVTPLGNVLRLYNYTMQTGDTLLVLVDGGDIYHVVDETTVHGPILSITGMTDFGFTQVVGRAFITPFNSTTITGGDTNEIGLEDEFLYVYKGDGTTARKAAGLPPIATAIIASIGGGTYNDLGIHIFAVVYETDTGYLTSLGPIDNITDKNPLFSYVTQVAENVGYTISNIPVSPDTFVTKRHIVATKAIPASVFNGDLDGYQFFFVPGGTIEDNVTTIKALSFYDIDLLEDASHLVDNFHEIPAGVALNTYNNRLVLTTEFDNISLVRVSAPGEPEAFDQVDGLVVIPLDGTPITNAQEFRDILYIFKKSGTWAVADNGDEPTTWVPIQVDAGIGCPVHGLATILDSGTVNTDYMLVASYSGLFLFNGTYFRPEASYKIQDLWFSLERINYRKIQMVIDTIKEMAYILIPDGRILFADFSEALTPLQLKWGIWQFKYRMTTICMTRIDLLIMAHNGELYS